MSPVQRQAMLAKARHVETESLTLASGHRRCSGDMRTQSDIYSECFYRYAADIAVAVQRAAETEIMAKIHKRALRGKVEALRLVRGTESFGDGIPFFVLP